MSKIQAELKETENKIAALDSEIAQKISEIEQKEEEIRITQEILEKKRQDLGNSISYLDQMGELGFLEFIFQSFKSKNLSEVLAARDFLITIRDENKTLFEDFKQQEANLQVQKKELDKQKLALDEKKKELDHFKKLQVQQKSEQDKLLAQFKEKESEIMAHIQEEEAAQAALNSAIADAIKKREEEKRQNGQTTQPPANTGGGTLAYPMEAGTYYISSGYGYRTHPVYGDQRLHNGTDFAAEQDTPIYASGDGYVLFAGPANGYGNWIVIEHSNGYYTIYGHMESNQIYVSPGQQVARGQHIAGIGSSGTSTGFHLHYCVATGYDSQSGSFNYIDPMSVLE